MINILETNLMKATKKYTNLVFLVHKDFVGLESFSKFFPDIFFNFGGGEQNLISAAVGFTVRGKMPLVFLPSSVLGSVYTQLKEDVCKPNLNIKIIVSGKFDDGELELINTLSSLQVIFSQDPERVPLLITKMIEDYGPRLFRL